MKPVFAPETHNPDTMVLVFCDPTLKTKLRTTSQQAYFQTCCLLRSHRHLQV
jgi:hypothetical protein